MHARYTSCSGISWPSTRLHLAVLRISTTVFNQGQGQQGLEHEQLQILSAAVAAPVYKRLGALYKRVGHSLQLHPNK